MILNGNHRDLIAVVLGAAVIGLAVGFLIWWWVR